MFIQEIMGFSYSRGNTLNIWIDHEFYKHFPLSYTINECLEDYCIEHRWDFHHIQFGCNIAGRNSAGQFYYYRILEPQKSRAKRVHFSWFTQGQERRLCLSDSMSVSLREGASVEDTLKEICIRRGWTFVSEYTYISSDLWGDGYLRYKE